MADGKWIPELTPEMPVADAARTVLAARFGVVRHFLPLAAEKPFEDVEYVHQLRVGTRRAGAALKVFLTATPQERAMRRHKQLKEKGIDVSLPDLSWDIAQRDARDASRSVAPLRPAADARVIDSTSLTPEEVIASILKWLAAAGIERGRV